MTSWVTKVSQVLCSMESNAWSIFIDRHKIQQDVIMTAILCTQTSEIHPWVVPLNQLSLLKLVTYIIWIITFTIIQVADENVSMSKYWTIHTQVVCNLIYKLPCEEPRIERWYHRETTSHATSLSLGSREQSVPARKATSLTYVFGGPV